VKQNGYTLIELALVIFLAGLMIIFAVPKIRETLIDDQLTATVRHFVGAVNELRNNAVHEQVDYAMHLDMNANSSWISSEDMTPEKLAEQEKEASPLPDGVRIVDISQAGVEKRMDGQVVMRMFKQGYIQPTVIHLRKDERSMTVFFQPFLSSPFVYNQYVDIRADGKERGESGDTLR
jgi:Tfp pilus assembly protein FimT